MKTPDRCHTGCGSSCALGPYRAMKPSVENLDTLVHIVGQHRVAPLTSDVYYTLTPLLGVDRYVRLILA
jgi:hypothetical protein